MKPAGGGGLATKRAAGPRPFGARTAGEQLDAFQFWPTRGCDEKANVPFPPLINPNTALLSYYPKGKLRPVRLGVSDAGNELNQEL